MGSSAVFFNLYEIIKGLIFCFLSNLCSDGKVLESKPKLVLRSNMLQTVLRFTKTCEWVHWYRWLKSLVRPKACLWSEVFKVSLGCIALHLWRWMLVCLVLITRETKIWQIVKLWLPKTLPCHGAMPPFPFSTGTTSQASQIRWIEQLMWTVTQSSCRVRFFPRALSFPLSLSWA